MSEWTTTYECAPCGASTTAVIRGLDDPSAFLARHGYAKDHALADELMLQSAKRELAYATCPRCGARNPEGVANEATSTRRTRWIGAAAFAALAFGIWRVPWLAYVVVALPVLQIVLVAALVRPIPGRRIVYDACFACALLAAAKLLPLVSVALCLAQAVRFAVHRGADEGPWQRAAEKIQFLVAYR